MNFELLTNHRMPFAEDERSVEAAKNFIKQLIKSEEVKPPRQIKLIVQARAYSEVEYTIRDPKPDKFDPKSYAQVGQKGQTTGFKGLIHGNNTSYNKFIGETQKQELKLLQLGEPQIKLDWLPTGSFWLKVEFELATPYFSKDDTPFYIIDNPLKKEKVFQVPYIAASSWKGNLRWTTMFTRLALKKEDLSEEEFAEERLFQTLLFGTEQGFDETRTSGFAAYLDNLAKGKDKSNPAKKAYRTRLKELFGTAEVPRLSGQLHFFPTYLDKIDMAVINRHKRTTRAGGGPVYYEIAPAGAKGSFHLLYVPGLSSFGTDAIAQSQAILTKLVPCLSDMFLRYGFSAKKTNGWGQVKACSINGSLLVAGLNLAEPALAEQPKKVEPKKKPALKNTTIRFQELGDYDFGGVLEPTEISEPEPPRKDNNKIEYKTFEDLLAQLEKHKADFKKK